MKLLNLFKIVAINESTQNGQSTVLNDLQIIARQYSIAISIIGGVAMQEYGYSRFTEDVDVLIKTNQAATLAKALIDLKYKDIGNNKLKHSSGFIVNICADSVRGRQQFNMPSPTAADGEINVYSLAGIIALKIETNRYKDRADIVELIKRNSLTLNFIESEVIQLIRTPLGHKLIINLWSEAQNETSND